MGLMSLWMTKIYWHDGLLSTNNIQLKSSINVKKDDFDRKLLAMRKKYPECLIWNRSLKSL